jgi:hypothetical protein
MRNALRLFASRASASSPSTSRKLDGAQHAGAVGPDLPSTLAGETRVRGERVCERVVARGRSGKRFERMRVTG